MLLSTIDKKMRLAILASATGTLLEWYDIYLAIILAKTLSLQLFPSGNSSYFLETLAIVGSSFFVRPIGSLLFGSLGDRKGRKKSFLLSLGIMGGATFLIGCIPSFQQIGWAAPIFLLICRLAQGLALSGEYSGAIIYVAENAPVEQRGFYTGFIQATVPVGLSLSFLVVLGTQSCFSTDDFNAWGWRVPFLSSAVLVIFSYLVRRRMEETPVFLKMQAIGNIAASPVRESFNSASKWRTILGVVLGGNAAQSAIMQTAQFVTLYYLQRVVRIEEILSYFILAVALILGTPFFVWTARWSDRIGRKKVIYAGICLSVITIPLAFYLFKTLGNPNNLSSTQPLSNSLLGLFVLLAFLNILASAFVYGPMGAYLVEYFTGRTRYTSMGFTYNISNGMIGGATPLVTEFIKTNWLITGTFAPFVGLIYPMSWIIIALIIHPFLKETRS